MMKYLLNKNKVIVFDIGNTVFDKNQQTKISEDFIKSLNNAQQNGFKVGCCTMRSYFWCKKFLKINLDFYICLNGSYVVVENKLLINKRINNFPKYEEIMMFGTKRCYFSKAKLKDMALEYDISAIKKTIKNPYVVTLFNINLADVDFYKQKYNCYYRKNTKKLNLQNISTSNLIAIKKIKEVYKVNSVIYFGDSINDLEIFKENRYSIMVKNGLPELKQYAYDVCDSCLNNGVAKYINRLISKSKNTY